MAEFSTPGLFRFRALTPSSSHEELPHTLGQDHSGKTQSSGCLEDCVKYVVT